MMRRAPQGQWIKYWDHGPAHFYIKGKRQHTLCGLGLNRAGPHANVSPGYDPCLRCEAVEAKMIADEGEAL